MSTRSSAFKSPSGEAKYLAAYEASMRLWPVTSEPRNVSSRFGSTYLVVCGPRDAPPLVLLHCFFTSLTIWAHNIGALSRDHRVFALDMMGQPSRSVPDQPMRNRTEMAEWLTGVLDALGLGRTDLVGYSYGGFAALNYAIRMPDRLGRLVLLTPVGGLAPLKRQFFVCGLLTLLPGRFWTNSLMHWFFYGPNLEDEANRRLFDRITDQFYLGVRNFRVLPTVPPAPYTDEELRGVKAPTLLLIGKQESLYDPVAAVERAKKLIPHIRTELIPHAGHDMPACQPLAVNQRILQFLEG